MKKIVSVFLCILMAFSLFGCSTSDTTTAKTADVTISESTYVTYINDIYTNPSNYLGKVITLDGMFTYEAYDGNTYYYVYRQGPGCCGNDGSMCGLEFTTSEKYPDYTPNSSDSNDAHPWIKVTGTLDEYYEGETGPYYTLKDSTVKIMDDNERGSAIVSL